MVLDSGAPRPAPRGDDRLPQRSGPAPRDRKNPRVGTAASVRARMECRTPQGPGEGGAEHRPVGADSRRRHDPSALQPPPPHPPDRRCLRGRHARLPRSAGGSTRGSSARGLAHPRGPSPSRISAVGIGWRGRPMKVVVLGGSGVAGRHVVEAFVVRSTQFYELLWRFRDWGPKDGVWRVPEQLVQPVAVAAMARVLAQMTLAKEPPAGIAEVAGPQKERLVDMATRWAARRGEPLEVQELPDDTVDGRASRSGALLPGPHAAITGPTFQQWLDAGERDPTEPSNTAM